MHIYVTFISHTYAYICIYMILYIRKSMWSLSSKLAYFTQYNALQLYSFSWMWHNFTPLMAKKNSTACMYVCHIFYAPPCWWTHGWLHLWAVVSRAQETRMDRSPCWLSFLSAYTQESRLAFIPTDVLERIVRWSFESKALFTLQKTFS